MDNQFGMKELYEVVLKATYPMKINDRTIETGEIITEFDKIQLANFNEIKSRVQASGGFDNRALVTWESTKEVDLNFTQGIFSKVQFGLLSNSHLLEYKEDVDSILITVRLERMSDENGFIDLDEEKPYFQNLFVYDKNTGQKYTDIEIISDTQINIRQDSKEVIVDYQYKYTNGATDIIVGRNLVDGFMFLEGKTRIKDDVTGRTRTGIIQIPRLKLVSDLSMRLGREANPIVANFRAVGYPVGGKGDKKVMDIFFLNDDIDNM